MPYKNRSEDVQYKFKGSRVTPTPRDESSIIIPRVLYDASNNDSVAFGRNRTLPGPSQGKRLTPTNGATQVSTVKEPKPLASYVAPTPRVLGGFPSTIEENGNGQQGRVEPQLRPTNRRPSSRQTYIEARSPPPQRPVSRQGQASNNSNYRPAASRQQYQVENIQGLSRGDKQRNESDANRNVHRLFSIDEEAKKTSNQIEEEPDEPFGISEEAYLAYDNYYRERVDKKTRNMHTRSSELIFIEERRGRIAEDEYEPEENDPNDNPRSSRHHSRPHEEHKKEHRHHDHHRHHESSHSHKSKRKHSNRRRSEESVDEPMPMDYGQRNAGKVVRGNAPPDIRWPTSDGRIPFSARPNPVNVVVYAAKAESESGSGSGSDDESGSDEGDSEEASGSDESSDHNKKSKSGSKSKSPVASSKSQRTQAGAGSTRSDSIGVNTEESGNRSHGSASTQTDNRGKSRGSQTGGAKGGAHPECCSPPPCCVPQPCCPPPPPQCCPPPPPQCCPTHAPKHKADHCQNFPEDCQDDGGHHSGRGQDQCCTPPPPPCCPPPPPVCCPPKKKRRHDECCLPPNKNPWPTQHRQHYCPPSHMQDMSAYANYRSKYQGAPDC